VLPLYCRQSGGQGIRQEYRVPKVVQGRMATEPHAESGVGDSANGCHGFFLQAIRCSAGESPLEGLGHLLWFQSTQRLHNSNATFTLCLVDPAGKEWFP